MTAVAQRLPELSRTLAWLSGGLASSRAVERDMEALPSVARHSVERLLESSTKRWKLERTAQANGAVTLNDSVRCRKRIPRHRLLSELRDLAAAQHFTVEVAQQRLARWLRAPSSPQPCPRA